jgi:hypothetical protein
MSNRKLSDEQKAYVVRALARCESVRSVKLALKTEFGIDLSSQAIDAYDPTKWAGRGLADRWRALFNETRKSFTEDLSSIGLAHHVVRLRELDRMFHLAFDANNLALAGSLVVEAAKLCGNYYVALGRQPVAKPQSNRGR